jgi:hypothetical protein
MARSFLIVLLSVVAVAGPTTAQGFAVPALPVLDDPNPIGPVSQPTAADCGAVLCEAVTMVSRCWPYQVSLDPEHWPGVNVAVDPDGCIRNWVDQQVDWPPREVVLLFPWAFASDDPSDADDSQSALAPSTE